MENINITEVILDKKIESYKFDNRNFQASGEITVTITLDEYRDLVTKVATSQHDIEKANNDKWKREKEIEELKKEKEDLLRRIYGSEPDRVYRELNEEE